MSGAAQVTKRAKYKISVKDPGTPGALRMVSFLKRTSFPYFLVLAFSVDYCFLFSFVQNDQKLMFMPDNRNSGAKLFVEFKSIQGDTFIYVFVCVCVFPLLLGLVM